MSKLVLVTGGGGGIGSAICKKFAEKGYQVIVTYNSNQEKALGLIDALSGNGHSIFHAPVNDLSKLEELKKFVQEKYGKLDVLVNNAGITTPIPHDDLESLTDEWIDTIMQTNFRGSFAMVRSMKDLLLKSYETSSQSSLVVNISSVAGLTGIGSNVAYCASKAAIDSMTRSLGRALAPQIRVVSVSPGWVLGEYTKNIDPNYLQLQMDKTPMARLAMPEDVAKAVFSLTDTLTFCTGNILNVDGGRPLL